MSDEYMESITQDHMDQADAKLQVHPYLGYKIIFEQTPIPDRRFDWRFYNLDSGDGGVGSSLEDCKAQIDEFLAQA